MTSAAPSSRHRTDGSTGSSAGSRSTSSIKVMLAQTASADEFDAAVIANIIHSSLRNRVDICRFQATEDGTPQESWLGGIRRFRRAVRENQPDIIHLYFGGNFLKAAPYILAARGLGAKLLCHQTRSNDDAMESAGFLARTFMRAALKRCSAVVVPAQFIKEELETVLPADRITVIRDAARLVDFRRLPNRNKARGTLNLRTDRTVVLTVTDEQSKPAVNDILAAAALVKRMDDSVQFVIAGHADTGSDNTDDNVKLIPGEVDDPTLGLLLGAADIYLVPACTDASPAAVVDAMGAGLPVIAPNTGVLAEMVEHEGTGLLLDPGKLGDLPDAVERLSKDRSLRRRMQKAAFARFRRMFDVERAMVPALRNLYKTLAPVQEHAATAEQENISTKEGAHSSTIERERKATDAPSQNAGTSERDTQGASKSRQRSSRRRRRRPQRNRQPESAAQARNESNQSEPRRQREERPNNDRRASSDQRESRRDRNPQRKQRPQRNRMQDDESDIVMPEAPETDARAESRRPPESDRRGGSAPESDRRGGSAPESDRSDETPRPPKDDTERTKPSVKVVFSSTAKPRSSEDNESKPVDENAQKKDAASETPDEARKRLEEAAERWEERL